jgi:hypothetical protein
MSSASTVLPALARVRVVPAELAFAAGGAELRDH